MEKFLQIKFLKKIKLYRFQTMEKLSCLAEKELLKIKNNSISYIKNFFYLWDRS